jgi:O-antigen/teichoic acid export membrane protein
MKPVQDSSKVDDSGTPAPSATGQQRAFGTIRGATTVVGDFAAMLASRAATLVIGLVGIALTTRLIGARGYGLLAAVTVLSTLIFTITVAWTNVSVHRYGREELELHGNMSRLTWNRAIIAAPLVAICVAIMLVLKLIHLVPSSMTWELVALILGSSLILILTDHLTGLLEAAGKMKTSAARLVLGQFLYTAAIAALFVGNAGVSAELVIALSIAAPLLVAVLTVPIVWKVGVLPLAWNRILLRRMLWLSVPMIGLMLGQYVLSSIDIFVLGLFRSQADVGIYFVAYQGFTRLSSLAVSVTSVLVPLFVSLELGGRSPVILRYLERSVPQALFILSVLGGVGVAILPLVFEPIFGAAFAPAVTPMAILTIGLIFLYGAYLVAPILTLHERTRAIAGIWGIAAAINVAGDFIMVGLLDMGIIAPAIATSAALTFVFAGFYACAEHVLDAAARPNAAMLGPFAAGLASALILGDGIGAVLGVGATLAIALVVIARRSPFRPEDVELIDKLSLPDGISRAARKAVLLAS